MQAARKLTRRAFREREQRFLIEGPVALQEALHAGTPLVEVFVGETGSDEVVAAARDAGAEIHEVSQSVLRAISDAVTPQGMVGVGELRQATLADLDISTGLVLVLEQLRDPGNAGTLIRSASASGCGGVVLTTGSVDPYGPKTLRSAAGAVFRTPLVTKVELDETLDHLRRAGFRAIGADARSSDSVYEMDLTTPVAVVLGNEAWGLPDTSGLDVTAGIPMPGDVESLNVGVAGSLFLFETVRQRQIASRRR